RRPHVRRDPSTLPGLNTVAPRPETTFLQVTTGAPGGGPSRICGSRHGRAIWCKMGGGHHVRAMNCAACQHENPAASAFCEECGARLERRCPSCGSPCTPAAKFCRSCGTALAGGPAKTADDAVARKVVTIVFADLMGSTSLHERLDPESVSRVMDLYHRAVRVPVEAHGGTVVQLLGDGVMCAFGVPRIAEDDAIRAVRAAVGIQRAFREFATEQRAIVGDVGLRVAVNTGEVVVTDDYT